MKKHKMIMVGLFLCFITSNFPAFGQSYKEQYRLGTAQAKARNFAKALEHFEMVLRVIPDHPYSNYLAALCHYRLNNFQGALGHLKKAVAAKPDWKQAISVLKRVQLKLEYEGINDREKDSILYSLTHGFRLIIPKGAIAADRHFKTQDQIKAIVFPARDQSFSPYISVHRALLEKKQGTELDILTNYASKMAGYLGDYMIKGRHNIPVGDGEIPEIVASGSLSGQNKKVPITVKMVGRFLGQYMIVAILYCLEEQWPDFRESLEACLYSLDLISKDPAWWGEKDGEGIRIARLGAHIKVPLGIGIKRPDPTTGALYLMGPENNPITVLADPVSFDAFTASKDAFHGKLAPIFQDMPVNHRYIENKKGIPAVFFSSKEEKDGMAVGFARYSKGFLVLEGKLDNRELIIQILSLLE